MHKNNSELEREALAQYMRELEEEAPREAFYLTPLPKEANLEVMRGLLKAEGMGVRLNLISGELEIEGLPDSLSKENALTTLPVLLRDILKQQGCQVTLEHAHRYLAFIADQNRYNPVADMLTSTAWDGVDRIIELDRILGIQDEPPPCLSQVYLRKWLIQSVALALNDEQNPVGAEGVLVLQGPQGIGKTRFFRMLAMRADWFCEGVTINMEDKETTMRALSVWIAELGELDSTVKREQSALKAFITQALDRPRPYYGRAILRRPRRTTLAATVNPGNFLRDETGNRRYWVVPVESMDLRALGAVSQDWTRKLWAQVYAWYLEGPQCFRLTGEEMAWLTQRNRSFNKPLQLETEIRDLLNFDMSMIDWRSFRASDIKQRIGMNGASAEQVGKVLKKLAEEDSRVAMHHTKAGNKYLLPVR